MPWYKAGTVSVVQNSNAVIGTGTAFIANSRVGDAFRGPDGGWYEVTNIASDTAMSISPNYQGATTGAGSYALAPLQGYVKDSADALRALVNQYGAKLAALGTTGNYEILPPNKGGTGISDLSAFIQTLLNDSDAAAGRATLMAAKSGVNSDITAIAGLTTALSVAQGGTGGNTQSAARTGLGLGSAAVAAILGTVSQSGGVPTGAIIENATNANGRYIKYADGTLICIGGINITASGTLAAVGSATLPYAMIDSNYYAGATMAALIGTQGFSVFRVTRSATAMTMDFWSISGGASSGTSAAAYLAIGRWF
jgi:hypothetical protein